MKQKRVAISNGISTSVNLLSNQIRQNVLMLEIQHMPIKLTRVPPANHSHLMMKDKQILLDLRLNQTTTLSPVLY